MTKNVMKKLQRKTRQPWRKWWQCRSRIGKALLILLSVIGGFLLYITVMILWEYDWTVESVSNDFPLIGRAITKMHENYTYLSEAEYLMTLGSPDGTWGGLAEVYDLTAPAERDAFLSDNGSPHHIFYEVVVPEKGLSLRMHNALTQPYQLPGQIPDQIVITGEQVRFGWREIGIGSTRREVERAYRIEAEYASYNVVSRLITSHRLPIEERAEDFSLGYRIGYPNQVFPSSGLDVLFRFDENDCVDMIVLNAAKGMPHSS